MGKALIDFGYGVANSAAGGIMGLALGGINDERQIRQQEKLQAMQIEGQKEMTEYQRQKQLQMWKDTNYAAQMGELKKAGLNPGLIYGMGGGGGSTTGGGAASGPSGGNAPTGGGEAQAMAGMGLQMGLLKAQKENIEADTANKKAAERDLTASAEGRGLENAFTAWMQGVTTEGEQAENIDKSIRGQKDVTEVNKNRTEITFKMDENERQRLMNSKVMEEIGAKISLMHKQGLSQDEIYKNLSKEGLLLDAEIEWNKLDISGNPGKFLTNIIKMLFRPR